MKKARACLRRRASALAFVSLLATSGVVFAAAPPAYSAPPSNDSIASARVITGIPSRIVQNTRQATSSADDGSLRAAMMQQIWPQRPRFGSCPA